MNVSMAPTPMPAAPTPAAPAVGRAASPVVGLAEAGGERPAREQSGDEQPDDFTAIIAAVAQTVVAAVENAGGRAGGPAVGPEGSGAVAAVAAVGDVAEETAPYGWAVGLETGETTLPGRGLGRAVAAEAALAGRAQPTLPDAAMAGRPAVLPAVEAEVAVPVPADVQVDPDAPVDAAADVDPDVEAIMARIGAQRGRGEGRGVPGSEVSAAARASAPGSEVSAAARAAGGQDGVDGRGEIVSEVARQAGGRADLTANGVRRSAAEIPLGPAPGTAGAAAHVPLVGPDGVEITTPPVGSGQSEVAAAAAAAAAGAARRAAPPPFVAGLAAGQRLTIDASDDTLGKLTITASTERGAVNLHLAAEEDRTRAALEQQQSELREELESAGVPLGNLDVTDGGELFGRDDDADTDAPGATRATGDRPGQDDQPTLATPAGLVDGHLDLHL